jgi:hypothetical protein
MRWVCCKKNRKCEALKRFTFFLNYKGKGKISRRGAGYADEYNLIFAALIRAIRVMRFNSDSDIFSHRGTENT